MALSSSEKKEIETLIRKEIKRGKLEGDVKELIVRSMSEFYQFLWTQRGTWEGRVRRA